MKKFIFCMILIMALAVIFCAAAVAEEYSPVEGGTLPTEPFSWDYLATILGATAATVLFVQLFKFPLDKIWKIPTRVVVYVIALIISLLATHFTVGLTAENGILSAFNALVVALAAMGTYEAAVKKLEK